MKLSCFAPLVAAGALAASPALAKDVVVRRSFDADKPVAAVVDAITAYDQYCARGCTHYIPSVATAQILRYARRPDDFYVWTSVKDIKDSSWFSHVTVERSERGARVVVRMVGDAEADALQKATKLEHAPSVDATINVYDLTELPSTPGKAHVTLTETVSISGVSALLGSGIVRDRLETAAAAMRRALTRTQ
jgi:hypothetical protein